MNNLKMLLIGSVLRQLEVCKVLYNNAGDEVHINVKTTVLLIIQNFHECMRSDVKRRKEKNLDEALKLLKRVPKKQLESLEIKYILPLVQSVLSMQLETLHMSTAFRKLDQIMQELSDVNYSVVFEEMQNYLNVVIDSNQMLEAKGLQTVCMFLEDSRMGHEVLRQAFNTVVSKVSKAFSNIMEQETLRNGDLSYGAVKVCLQLFQLLPEKVVPLVWEKGTALSPVQGILMYLMDIILGEGWSRDTRFLAATAVAMLVNSAPEAQDAAVAAWSLLEITRGGPWQLGVGELKVRCVPRGRDHTDRLALIRGLLTCCRRDVLLCDLQGKEACLLLEGLFPLISSLCEENLDCHYYVFQVFALWLRSVKECVAGLWNVRGAPLLQEDSSFCQQLVQVIWNNAESPVEGISEFVHGSFRFLLEIYGLECQHFANTQKHLYLLLLRRITALPWEAKARYFPLCALLPHVGTSAVFEHFPELPSHLLKCLSTNHLSPCASEAYRCAIQQQRRELCGGVAPAPPSSELELAQHWAQRWQSSLLEALTSDTSLLQSNACSHLLPWTLRTFPGAFELLQAALCGASPGQLRAWASLMSAWRAEGGSWSLEDDTCRETLHLALSSLDDSVRLSALGLLCGGPGTRCSPTVDELTILKDCIPLNLNSESSPFRQQMQARLKKLLVCVRDSCLARLREEKRGGAGGSMDPVLEDGVAFVDWLAQLQYTSLAPGHSYQRKKTALLLLSVVLETCTDTWSPDKKKGQPPVDMLALIKWAQHRGLWDFFSRSKLLVLIGCLEDTTNEIRETAVELLLKFFPPGLPEELSPVLLKRAQTLLCSPRVPEAQMGALFFKVLLLKCEDLSVVLQQEVQRCDRPGVPQASAEAVVQHLLRQLELHYLTAQTHMLQAARTTPIHGVVCALQRCLLDSPCIVAQQQGAALIQRVMGTIVRLLEKITLLLLGVLYGDTDGCTEEEDAPPSFCAMGNAIRSVIAQGGGQEAAEGSECVLLSEEHSLVLTCCWVSFKEIGTLLGGLVEKVLMERRSLDCPFNVGDVRTAAKIFRNILLKCRHWGAVEGCCGGFTRFCSALLGCQNTELQEIPGLLLEQALSMLQAPRTASVTRRAAGLPMLVLCIVSAEEAGKARPFLALCMRVLLETAARPLPDGWDQTLDLPQVCAVHTLQALVRGSGLGVAVLQFASSVAILSLTLLSSPCWAMRNASLQLYNALCCRMLGQRPGGSDDSVHHGMSPPAFFAHYPALLPFLLGKLHTAASELCGGSTEARLRLHPSLFPVLTLLAKLQPGFHDNTQGLSAFLVPLLQLAGNPVYHVRVMASKALVAMTPSTEYMNILLRLAKELPERVDLCCHNRLHGQLLQMGAVLGRALSSVSDNMEALAQLVVLFESRRWLVTSAQKCPLIRLSYLSVLSHLSPLCSPGFLEQLQPELLLSPDQEHQLGSASFREHATRFLCNEAMRHGDLRWVTHLWENLLEEDTNVQLALVRWVLEDHRWRDGGLHQLLQMALQTNLKVALLNQSIEYRKVYLAALVAVLDPKDSAEARQYSSEEGAELLLRILEGGEGGPELRSQGLIALSLLLPHSSVSPLTERWCSLLEMYKGPEFPEVLRLACAQALHLAGPRMLHSSLRSRSSKAALGVRLISAGLQLLTDEDQRVRAGATAFTSALGCVTRGENEQPRIQVQSGRGLPLLLGLLLEMFGDSPVTLEVLLSHLPEFSVAAVLRDAQSAGHFSLYEKDEANMFVEPSVMSETLLPFLLKLAETCTGRSPLRDSMVRWARENAVLLQENISLCKQFNPDALAWLSLLVKPQFHSSICSLFVRAAFLLRLLDTCEDLRPLCDAQVLRSDLQLVHSLLSHNGVLLPRVISTAFTPVTSGDTITYPAGVQT